MSAAVNVGPTGADLGTPNEAEAVTAA
jgi:hypothetical protein